RDRIWPEARCTESGDERCRDGRPLRARHWPRRSSQPWRPELREAAYSWLPPAVRRSSLAGTKVEAPFVDLRLDCDHRPPSQLARQYRLLFDQSTTIDFTVSNSQLGNANRDLPETSPRARGLHGEGRRYCSPSG